MKKAFVAALTLAVACGMVGCGSTKKAESTVSSAAAAAESAVSEAASEAQAAVSEAAAAADEAVSEVVAAADAAADAASTVEEAADEAVSAVEEVPDAVVSAAENTVEEAASVAEEAVDGAADAAAAALGTAAAAVDGLAADAASTVEEAASVVEDAAAAAATVAEDVAGASVAEDVESGAEEMLSVMSFDEFAAADVDAPVMVETYVQAKQAWYEEQETATVYTQDEEGAYFAYDMHCTKEDYDKLTEGQKIVITGYKGEWSGEVEIVDATFELADGNYVAEPEDVTALLGTDDLAGHMNEKVAFKGLTVEAAEEGGDAAFLYNWDGSGQEGDDLYFKASLDGETYTFVVESYLCDSSSDVYKAVKELKVGDTIDMEGFLYWYEGAQPHITSVTAA